MSTLSEPKNNIHTFLTRPESEETFIEDNETCWGNKGDLKDLRALLDILDKSKTILHECKDYIAIDKPPDLRMDGCYRASVHKLTSYWYPSHLLRQQTNLLQAVECLHRHNYLKDNELRPIHQLDFPTSGVLIIGRNKKAAAVAGESFVNRTARKSYLAIVHGHLNVVNRDLPILNASRLNFLSESERDYKKIKDPKGKGDTFIGFVPLHTAFIKWQSAMKEKIKLKEIRGAKELEEYHAMKKQRLEKKMKKGYVLNPKEFDQVMEKSLHISEKDSIELLEMKWKDVKCNIAWKDAFENMTKEYNRVLKGKHDRILNPPTEKLPRLFRVQGENENTFYIYAPCAQVKERYKMMLLPDSLVNDPSLIANDEQIETLDFKPALTKCTILERGYLSGKATTKVKLSPHTGRRHQLRLHMVVAGSPIVGDISYENESNPWEICSRMCLHAHKLTLDLKGKQLTVMAPDPFIVERTDVGGSNERLVNFHVKIPGK